MGITKQVVKNSTFLYAADLISRFSSALLTILIARRFGSEDLGRFSYVNSVIAILSTISTFGLSTFLVRQAARDQEENIDKFHSKIFTLRLLINAVMAIGLSIYIQLFINDSVMKTLFHLSNIASLLSIYYTHWILIFRLREKMEYEGVINALSSVLYGVIGILLIVMKQGIISISILSLLLVIFRSILLARYIKLILKIRLFFIFNFRDFLVIFKQAYPFALMAILGVIYFKIDVILIEHFLGISAVGYYSASYRIMEILMAIPSIFSTAALPVISRNLEHNTQLISGSIFQLLRVLNLIGFPLAIGGTLLADKGIILLYGNKFQASIPVFQILAWALIALFNSAITTTIINASKRPAINIYISIINLIVNVGLNLILIPKIGINGGAIATVITEFVCLAIGALYIHKDILPLNFYKEIPKVIFASIIMAIVIIFKKNLIFIPVYIVIYLVSIICIGYFKKEDINSFLSMVSIKKDINDKK